MVTEVIEREYMWGQCRNDENATAHIYECEGSMNPIGPLCIYGWNRSQGFAFSILRNVKTGSSCKTCMKRKKEGKGMVQPVEHKTRWI